ncbi:hypothetical protein H0H92_007781 [Tricholoma furcatifolium]|nr:hypothetical protein H0H92_007781 [Tricholoma furcatifolium]
MAALSGSDWAFAEKLANAAGATNELVVLGVPDVDFMRGRKILSTVKEKLRNCSSDSAEHAELTELFAKLSVAVAPHKKAPLEVVQIIFRFCMLCDENKMLCVKLFPTPENRRQAPLVLGQVCQKWRLLSRSMPSLWFAEIMSGWHSITMDQLKYADRILPDCAKLRLSYGTESSHDYLVETIHLYLVRHVTGLELGVQSPAGQESLRLLRSGSFSRLVYLDISPMQDSEDTQTKSPYNMNLFGKLSKLERLTLRFDSPSFLLTDIPWSGLRTFNLILSNRQEAWREAGWVNLASRLPFSLMSCLTEMSLVLPDQLIPIILCYSFPWENLTSFTFAWPWATGDFSSVVKSLKRCSSLKYLKLDLGIANPASMPDFHVANISMPFSLESLTLCKIPFTLAIYLCATSGHDLRNLKITSSVLVLPELCSIMKECPSLVDLSCSIDTTTSSPCASSHSLADEILLSDLSRLDLTVGNGSLNLFSKLLCAPALTSLEIRPSGRASDIADGIVTLITRSNMKLRLFNLRVDPVFECPTMISEALLNALESCHSVGFIGVSLNPDYRNLVMSGTVLQNASCLRLTFMKSKDFLDIIEADCAARRLNLRKSVVGYLRHAHGSEQQAEKIHEHLETLRLNNYEPKAQNKAISFSYLSYAQHFASTINQTT